MHTHLIKIATFRKIFVSYTLPKISFSKIKVNRPKLAFSSPCPAANIIHKDLLNDSL